ncbi:MAG: TRAP transporter TatT component family protein [Betaproteobacteria bacterium]|nr:TRAP transporter TatT component family protein [Betaproteobacteria bacterium]MDH3437911.1 TRAP transporter TatT component family protein [Betaproteobacteria bacterium]
MTKAMMSVACDPPNGRRVGSAALALLLVVTLMGGCSVRNFALNQVGDALANSGSTFASDDDLQLIGAAAPFSLKLMESVLAETPDNRGLLLATTRGFVQYSYAYVEFPADEIEDRNVKAAYAQRDRARRLYLRARNYGLQGLETSYPGLTKSLRTNPAGALSATTVEDVGLLYWTGVAWAAAISLSKDNPFLVADLPIVEALVRRALVLDETYDHGAVHVFLISYEMSRSGVNAGAADLARQHFDRAVELSEGKQAAPFVTFAEAVSVTERDRTEFEKLLQHALKLNVNADPEGRLANLVMQRRARWLLGRTDVLFAD